MSLTKDQLEKIIADKCEGDWRNLVSLVTASSGIIYFHRYNIPGKKGVNYVNDGSMTGFVFYEFLPPAEKPVGETIFCETYIDVSDILSVSYRVNGIPDYVPKLPDVPKISSVSPSEGVLELGLGESFKMTIAIDSQNPLVKVLVSNNLFDMYTLIPDENKPLHHAYSNTVVGNLDVSATYTKSGDSNVWEIDFGKAVTDSFVKANKLSFFIEAISMDGSKVGDAYNKSLESVYKYEMTMDDTDEIPPTWPEGSELAIGNVTINSMAITWPQATDNVAVSKYKVYVNDLESTTLDANITSYNIKGLDVGTDYNIGVTAIDTACNESVPLEKSQRTLDDTEAPTWPRGAELKIDDVTVSSIAISWPQAVDNVSVTGYIVYSNDTELKRLPNSVTADNIQQLTPDTEYNLSVSAIDAAGNESIPLTKIQGTLPDTTPPTWPQGSKLNIDSVDMNSIGISWPAATDDIGVNGYRIYVNDNVVDTLGGSVLSYNIVDLTMDTSYKLSVVAFDGSGNDSSPLENTQKTAPDTEPPKWPQNSEITIDSVQIDSIGFSWPQATDNVQMNGYKVYVNDTLQDTLSASTTSYNKTGLSPDTDYVLKVVAIDTSDNESSPLEKTQRTDAEEQPPDQPPDGDDG